MRINEVPQRPADHIFPQRREAIARRICVFGHEVTGFKDALSEREFGISGMCQDCQDSVFGEPDE